MAAHEPGDLLASGFGWLVVADPGSVTNDLGDRPEGDALPIGKTATTQYGRILLDHRDEFADKARLAGSRLSENGDKLTVALRARPRERLHEHLELRAAPNERRMEPASEAGRGRIDRENAPCRHRLGLSLERKRRDNLDRYGVAHEPVGGLADEDLVGSGGLLEPGGDVHRVAGGEGGTFGQVAGHDLACVDARSDLQALAETRLQLRAQGAYSLAHLDCRPKRADGVVLVPARNAEDSDHGIADELLDGAAMAFERRPRVRIVARHHPAQRLGVEGLSQRRRACHVREDHRYCPARRGRLLLASEPKPATRQNAASEGFCAPQAVQSGMRQCQRARSRVPFAAFRGEPQRIRKPTVAVASCEHAS